MTKSPAFKFSQLIFFFLLPLLATSVLAQEVEDESEFNYIEGDERGPENWGNIKEEWAICNTGKSQSPIDLLPRTAQPVPFSENIFRFYNPGYTFLKNRGHDLKLEWTEGGGGIQINGTHYVLVNCHWHSPSEHAINGYRYPLEAHFVHLGPDNKIAVIGFLYNIGTPDLFLSSIEDKIKQISGNSGVAIPSGVIHPLLVRKPGSAYYRYMGSLTTPACNEGVLWTVETKIGTVSKEQVKLLREAVHDNARFNARPLQPSNGRKVHLYNSRRHMDKFIRTYAESM